MQLTAQPHKGKNANGHNRHRMLKKGRNVVSLRIKTNPAGIQANASTALPRMSHSTNTFLRNSWFNSTMFDLMMRKRYLENSRPATRNTR